MSTSESPVPPTSAPSAAPSSRPKAAKEKMPAKIKKSVQLEQERLISEGVNAASIEAARKEVERKKKEETDARAVADTRTANDTESARLYSQQASDVAHLSQRAKDLLQLEDSVYEKTSWDKYLEVRRTDDRSIGCTRRACE
jgi:hypothetical protein